MKRRWQRSRAVAAGTAISITAVSAIWTPALGQEDGGPLFTLEVSSSLEASDNADLEVMSAGDTTQLETALTLGLESVNRTQALRFSVSDMLRVGEGPGAETGFLGPSFALSYERQAANAQLSFSATQRIRQVDGELTVEDLDDPDALVVDSGTLTRTNLGAELKTGLQAPLGTELSLSQVRRVYSGTADPDLEDTRSRTGAASVVLRPNALTTARLTYEIIEFMRDDAVGTERTTNGLDIDVRRQLDPTTTVSGSIGWTEISETQTAVPLTLPENRGLTASLGYNRELPAGEISGELSREITSAGGRTDFSVTRSFEFPAQLVEVTLGVTKPDNDSIQPNGRIAYSRTLADQRFSIAVSTAISVDSDSDIRRETIADVGYSMDLTERDRLNLNANLAKTEGLDGSTTDRTRASTSAVYSRDLTSDWTLSGTLTHRLSRDGGAGTARSNTASFTLGRDFSWRP